MKKIIPILLAIVLLLGFIPMSNAFASDEKEYLSGGEHTGIWYSNPSTKAALDKCSITTVDTGDDTYIIVDLNYQTIDLYDDLVLTSIDEYTWYDFDHGWIRCHDCRAFYLEDDNINLSFTEMTIGNGNAICEDDDEYGEGGAIYVDGAHCTITDTHDNREVNYNGDKFYVNTYSYIKDCSAKYGGAIAVNGHDCTINGLTFGYNHAPNNGGNDLYVYWGECDVNDCTFERDQEGACAYITADTYFNGCNILGDMCTGDMDEVHISNSKGSVVSSGNSGIVYGIGGPAIGFVVAMFIFRKKDNKPVPADGKTDNNKQ